jgi:chromate reductase, NAD(P)H dehydrogenase (quinone)
MTRKKILAISGSTRKESTNHSLIKAIADLYAERLDISMYEGLVNLPQYNPDDDVEDVDAEVAGFRQRLNAAEGILICTPEYAHGVPGSLKNAIDWTVSSSNFPGKPTLLITASTDGSYGHRALLETLKAIDAKNIDNLQLLISFVKTKLNMENKIIDKKTLKDVQAVITDLISTIDEKEAQEIV